MLQYAYSSSTIKYVSYIRYETKFYIVNLVILYTHTIVILLSEHGIIIVLKPNFAAIIHLHKCSAHILIGRI